MESQFVRPAANVRLAAASPAPWPPATIDIPTSPAAARASRPTPSDHQRRPATRAVLRAGGYPYVEGETLIVEVEDRPGGLAAVAEKLAVAGVDIRGVLFVGRRAGTVETAFSVDDLARARKALGLD